MTDFYDVRKTAKRKGPLGDSDAPIPIHPTNEYVVDRLIPMPVLDGEGKKIVGLYTMNQALITVAAFNAAEAATRADDIAWNTRDKAWGQGSKPWSSDKETKVSWSEVPVPLNTQPLELR